MKTTIVNAHVISPGVDLENAVVVVEDGRIKSVRKGPASAKADKNNTVVDVRGQYLMPGFMTSTPTARSATTSATRTRRPSSSSPGRSSRRA